MCDYSFNQKKKSNKKRNQKMIFSDSNQMKKNMMKRTEMADIKCNIAIKIDDDISLKDESIAIDTILEC